MTKRLRFTMESLKALSHAEVPGKLCSLERTGDLFGIADCVPENYEASAILATLLTRGSPSSDLKRSLKRRDLMKRLMDKVCSSYVLTEDITFCLILLHALGPDGSFIQQRILEHILVMAFLTWSTSAPAYQLRCIYLSLQSFFKLNVVMDYIKSEAGSTELTLFTELSTVHEGFATAAIRLLERDGTHSVREHMRNHGVVNKLLNRLLSSGASMESPGMMFLRLLSSVPGGHLDEGLLESISAASSFLETLQEDVWNFLVDQLKRVFRTPSPMLGDALMALASLLDYKPGEDPEVLQLLMHNADHIVIEAFPTKMMDQVRSGLESLMMTGAPPSDSFMALVKVVGARSGVELRRIQEKKERVSALGLEFPSEFQCPITLSPMEDPVVASDGHTYERQAILRVLQGSENPTSPLTREVLLPQVYANRNLKASILEYEERILLASDRGREGSASVCGGTMTGCSSFLT